MTPESAPAGADSAARSAIVIRPFVAPDWPAVWALLYDTFQTGDTYTFAPESNEADIHKAWIEGPAATFVAVDGFDSVVGTYFLRANQPGLGSHVGNCGYAVARAAYGRGVATMMCEHSQDQARRMGFRALQFNFVVSTNTRAVALWQRLGFAIVGRLPGAFRHAQYGYVEAFVMFKNLASAPASD